MQSEKVIYLTSDVTSNECIAGTGWILERSVIQVSTQKHDINVQYLYDSSMATRIFSRVKSRPKPRLFQTTLYPLKIILRDNFESTR